MAKKKEPKQPANPPSKPGGFRNKAIKAKS
jgi:hypothetical protein